MNLLPGSPGKFFQEVSLLQCQFTRYANHDLDVLIALLPPTQTWHSIVLEPEHFSALRPSRYFHLNITIECRDMDFSTKRCRDKTQGQLHIQIVLFPLKNIM